MHHFPVSEGAEDVSWGHNSGEHTPIEVVEENEPRLIKPTVEVMNSKTSGGSLQVVVAGFIEGESDPLQLITSVYG